MTKEKSKRASKPQSETEAESNPIIDYYRQRLLQPHPMRAGKSYAEVIANNIIEQACESNKEALRFAVEISNRLEIPRQVEAACEDGATTTEQINQMLRPFLLLQSQTKKPN